MLLGKSRKTKTIVPFVAGINFAQFCPFLPLSCPMAAIRVSFGEALIYVPTNNAFKNPYC